MLNLVKRNGYWYVRGKFMGEKVRESTGFPADMKAAAERVRHDIEKRIIDGDTPKARTNATWAEAAAMYVARPEGIGHNDRLRLGRFEDYWGAWKLRDIGSADIAEWVATDMGHLQASTVHRNLTGFRAVMMRAVDVGWLAESPKIKMPRVDDARDRWLETHEIDRFVSACHGDLAYMEPLVILLLDTGARLGEAAKATLDDVDMIRWAITYTSKKGRRTKKRTVPLTLRCRRMVQGLAGQRHIALNSRGEPWKQSKGGGYGVGKSWHKVCERAGITDFRRHDCRHTYATQLRLRGVDLATLADLLGHSSLEMVRRYAHIHGEYLQAAVSKLDRARHEEHDTIREPNENESAQNAPNAPTPSERSELGGGYSVDNKGKNGAGDEIRTHDFNLGKVALYP